MTPLQMQVTTSLSLMVVEWNMTLLPIHQLTKVD